MSPMKTSLAVTLGLFLFSACSPPRAFPQPLPTPTGAWRITLTQTGGFAGVHRLIHISSDGQMTAEDLQSGRSVSKPLSDATLQELSRRVAEIQFPAPEVLPSTCADCFVYELEIALPDGVMRLRADDTTLGKSSARVLIKRLGELRDQALRPAD
jgi:hypothetical protein